MAMNKKEQAERQALLDEIARLKAWRLTQPVERDLPAPSYDSKHGELTLGWDFNVHACEVYKACSSSVSHGRGWDRTSSQRPLNMFSTRDRAYAALRYAVEQACITQLAAIDREMASDREVA